MQRKENTLLDDSGSEPTDLYRNGTSGAVGTSGSVLRTSTWVASQAVRPASIPSLSATKQPVRLFELTQQKDSTVCYWMIMVPFGIDALQKGYNERLRSGGPEW